MSSLLTIEQLLNGLQFGLMLSLLAAGLTLVFGIMDMIILAHGSLYMVGAYLTATLKGCDRLVLCPCAARSAGDRGDRHGAGSDYAAPTVPTRSSEPVLATFATIRGALVGALLAGFVDTCGRAFLPLLLRQMFTPEVAANLGPALAAC